MFLLVLFVFSVIIKAGSVLDAMAQAVEKASIVIVCLSQKYKDSPSCRTEAEYTFRLRKKVIPLRLQPKYYPDGWLGIIVGSQLVFDVSVPSKIEESTRNLIRELGKTGGKDEVDGLIKPQKAQMTHTIYPSHELHSSSPVLSWTPEDIEKWINKNNLQKSNGWLRRLDGPLLVEYNCMRQDAPEAFYAYLMKKDLDLAEALAVSKALKELPQI